MTYSEHELEFTFAKNREGLVKGKRQRRKGGEREKEKERSLTRSLGPLLKNPRSATVSVVFA